MPGFGARRYFMARPSWMEIAPFELIRLEYQATSRRTGIRRAGSPCHEIKTRQLCILPDMNHRFFVFTLILTGLIWGSCAGAQTEPSTQPELKRGETAEQHDVRMQWWREARFGMFIHWGVYSVPAGTYNGKKIDGIGEWIMNHGKIPVAEYAKFATQFNPTKFDADTFVETAQAAGMKYMVITAKHHDGFAMFHTKVDGYNIYDATPFKRDPLAELAAACKRHGMKLGFYYSQCQDWHHPGGEALHGGHWDKAQDGDFDDYLNTVAIPQLKELLSDYGPVSVLWFDTPTKMMTSDRAANFLPLLDLQPQMVVNNRLGGGFKGDTETPEQHVPPEGFPGRDWETCMTINDTWGYKSYDTNFKSTETLLHNLVDIASKGGNYLLNVGPTSEGIIPKPEVDRLKEIGLWLSVNGESIYGTGPTVFGPEAGHFDPVKKDKKGKEEWVAEWAWRCTSKPGKLYIHLLSWPGAAFETSGVKGVIGKAYMLADPAKSGLVFKQERDHLVVTLPAAAPDKIDSVLVLEMTGRN
jgi:alpha-L-fucosidase